MISCVEGSFPNDRSATEGETSEAFSEMVQAGANPADSRDPQGAAAC